MDIKKQWNFPYPENLKKYDNLSTMSGLLTDDIVDNILPAIDTVALYLNMELLTDEILDELAIIWNVEFYDSQLPKNEKIDLIKNSYYFHSQKGTRGVLEDALKLIYENLKLEEWYEYGGNPYFFKIYADRGFTQEELDKIISFTEIYKNTRSTLETIQSRNNYNYNIKAGMAAANCQDIKCSNLNGLINVAIGSSITLIQKFNN